MPEQEITDITTKNIERIVNQLNDCWINDKLDNMEMFFHRQVVLVAPGTNRKITGREKMIDSYREFVDSADVRDFKIQDLLINVFDHTAVAFYTFRIKYRVESTNYDETGSETLVFSKYNDRWQIVWRRQEPDID